MQRPTPSAYIAVEGPIGVGKTTLVARLAARLRARVVLEVFEENPFLADFYRDPERFAFQTEMFFLIARFRQQEELAQRDLFSPAIVSDYLFVKSRLFATLTLSDDELALFDRMYTILEAQAPKPDVIVALDAPVDVLIERIEGRGRAYESGIDPSYLSRLRSLYANYFAHLDGPPVVRIDTSRVDLRCDDEALETIVARIEAPHRFADHPLFARSETEPTSI